MHGTKQIGISLKWGPYDNHTQPRTNPNSQGEFGIDPRIGVAATRAPVASREDSCPQAILKVHCPSSLDYRACHGLPFWGQLIGSSCV